MTSRGGVSILPVPAPYDMLNPAKMATFQTPNLRAVGYVLWKESDSRTRPTRVVLAQDGGRGWKLDDQLHLYHFQTGLSLGLYRICGIVRNDNGAQLGDVPDRMIKVAEVKP